MVIDSDDEESSESDFSDSDFGMGADDDSI
jgi:hypothetical protein